MKKSQVLITLIFIVSLIAGGVILYQINTKDISNNTIPTQSNETSKSEGRPVANKANLDFENIKNPENLANELSKGGYVLVFRYTGSGGESSQIPQELKGKVIDDGQRISESSLKNMKLYGDKVKSLGIQIDKVATSEYFFVWQHANAAFGDNLEITRDLTGSLFFNNPQELQTSLQNLQNRTVKVPSDGKSTLLFTHQGKFDKAFGYYPPAGTTIVFKPNGTSQPNLVAVLSFDEFMGL